MSEEPLQGPSRGTLALVKTQPPVPWPLLLLDLSVTGLTTLSPCLCHKYLRNEVSLCPSRFKCNRVYDVSRAKMLPLYHSGKRKGEFTSGSEMWLLVGTIWGVLQYAATWSHLTASDCVGLDSLGIRSFLSCPGGSIAQPRLKTSGLGHLAFLAGHFIHRRELGLIWTPFLHSTIDFLTLLVCFSANALFSSFNYAISLSLYYWEYLTRFLKQQLNLSTCHFVFIIHDSNRSNSLWEHIKWLVLNKQTKTHRVNICPKVYNMLVALVALAWSASDSGVHSSPQSLLSRAFVLSTVPLITNNGVLFSGVCCHGPSFAP